MPTRDSSSSFLSYCRKSRHTHTYFWIKLSRSFPLPSASPVSPPAPSAQSEDRELGKRASRRRRDISEDFWLDFVLFLFSNLASNQRTKRKKKRKRNKATKEMGRMRIRNKRPCPPSCPFVSLSLLPSLVEWEVLRDFLFLFFFLFSFFFTLEVISIPSTRAEVGAFSWRWERKKKEREKKNFFAKAKNKYTFLPPCVFSAFSWKREREEEEMEL